MPPTPSLGQRHAAQLIQRTTARSAHPSYRPRLRNNNNYNRRYQSNNTNPTTNTSTSSSSTANVNASAHEKQTNRISRLLSRASRFLPKRLQTSLQDLRSAPLSHVGAFLILHEITAVVPIFGLAYLFHTLDWVPTSWVLGPWAAWAEDGLKKYVPYFRRKKWFGLDRKGDASSDGEEALENELREEVKREREGREGKKGGWFARFSRRAKDDSGSETPSDGSAAEPKKRAVVWQKVKNAATVENSERGYKIGIQIAAAYTITKFLLIPRIAFSLWLTPWFARGLIGFRRAIWKKRPTA
ncbi:hypothetical protein F5Y17DRAFT_352038 [Xylariaceae sp. FL0594]|nr:hypothetical protein F5Y17DRAFT_352038 [Xylariaceae sp. FL0594]